MVLPLRLLFGTLLGTLLRGQHGPGAAGRTAAAGEQLFQGRRMALVVDERVVVVQFLTRLDRMQGVDIDPALVLVGFAIRRAGMVDPARVVAALAAVDDAAVGQAEIKGVVDRAAALFRALGPASMWRRAKTPLPWTGDCFTS
jgi:hypothetical protein